MLKKNNFFLIMLLLFFSCSLWTQEKNKNLQAEKIPANLKEFKKVYKELAGTPEGATFCFMLALKIYTENSDLGEQCLARCINTKIMDKTEDGWKVRRAHLSLIKSQLKYHPYLPDSYFMGSSPENAYQAKTPYRLKFTKKPNKKELKTGRVRCFIKSFGADSPRPITLVQTKSKKTWKAHEWSSLLSGIRAPEKESEEDEDYF